MGGERAIAMRAAMHMDQAAGRVIISMSY